MNLSPNVAQGSTQVARFGNDHMMPLEFAGCASSAPVEFSAKLPKPLTADTFQRSRDNKPSV